MVLIKFFALLIGHAFADFVFQTEFIANNKNRHSVPKGYDPKLHGKIQTIWPYVLTSHALVHGGIVWAITGNVWLGLAETICHWLIDFGKCEKWYGIHQDQFAHIVCKVIWSVL